MSHKAVSFRDLLKVSWLSKYNEINLLSIDLDEEVQRVLSEIGFDCEYPIEYSCANHRDLTGKTGVGFMAIGDVSINRKHLTSAYADLTDIMISASYQDPSLAWQLGELSGKQRSYDNNLSLEDDFDRNYPKELLQLNYSDVEWQIKEMNDLCEHIRGSKYGPSGGLKTTQEYKEFAAERNQNNKGNK